MGDKAIYTCPDEAELAAEFPRLYHFCMEYPVRRPQSPVVWERVLRVARVTKPILDQMRAEGLDVVSLENAMATGVDRLPLYRAVLHWLAEIRDPLSMTICLCRLLEPEAAALLRRNRKLLLRLAQEWNRHPDRCDGEMTLSVLAQSVTKVARECDVEQIVAWARDCNIGDSAQFSYVQGLRPLVRKSGGARQALIELIGDPKLGVAAVWVLAGAMKAEALPLLCELHQSSPDAGVRQAAADAARRIEARAKRVRLPTSSPQSLPREYESTSIEFDTIRVPRLLEGLERELGGCFDPNVREQLAASANQLSRGKGRFHVVRVLCPNGAASPLGFGFLAEDEDVIVVELWFDPGLEAAVRRAFDLVGRC